MFEEGNIDSLGIFGIVMGWIFLFLILLAIVNLKILNKGNLIIFFFIFLLLNRYFKDG
jgi:hypothetical protein